MQKMLPSQIRVQVEEVLRALQKPVILLAKSGPGQTLQLFDQSQHLRVYH